MTLPIVFAIALRIFRTRYVLLSSNCQECPTSGCVMHWRFTSQCRESEFLNHFGRLGTNIVLDTAGSMSLVQSFQSGKSPNWCTKTSSADGTIPDYTPSSLFDVAVSLLAQYSLSSTSSEYRPPSPTSNSPAWTSPSGGTSNRPSLA